MLDEHIGVSYPDFTEDGAGNICAVYDRTRVKGHGQVWFAKFTEADILAGAFVTPGSTAGILVDAFPFKPGK